MRPKFRTFIIIFLLLGFRGRAFSQSDSDPNVVFPRVDIEPGEIIFCFEADDEIRSTPAIGEDGTIYFGTQNATLYAVDPNGKLKWNWMYETTGWGPLAFEAAPVIADDGTIYVADDIVIPNYLFAISPEGEKKWQYITKAVYGSMYASPVLLSDGTIFAGGHGGGRLPSGQIVALSPNGEVLEGFPIYTQPILASPVAVNDVVIVGGTAWRNGYNQVFAVNKNSDILWRTELYDMKYTSGVFHLSSLAADHKDNIYAANNFEEYFPDTGPPIVYSTLVQLDSLNGEKLFEMEIPTLSIVVGSPVIDSAVQGANVIVATENAHVVSINPYADGEKLNYDLDLGENSEAVGTPVIGDNGKLYHAVNSFGDTNQIDIFEINADGTINDDVIVTILNDQVSSSLTMDNNGVIYFGTKGGKMYAVQTGARGLSRDAPWPTFRHDIRNTGNSELHPRRESTQAGEILFCFEADGQIISTPSIADDGTIYFGTQNATLFAVEPNGNPKWQWKYDGWGPQAFESSPLIGDDGTIYVADDIAIPNYFFALSPEGEKKWEYETHVVYGAMDASPVLLSDGTIFAGAHGFSGYSGPVGQLVALTSDGAVLDGFPLYTKAIYNSPVAVDDVVVVGESGLNYTWVFAINKNAEILWETKLYNSNSSYWRVTLSSLAVDHEKNILVAQNSTSGSSNFTKSTIFQFDSLSGEQLFEMEISKQSRVVGSPIIDAAEFGANVIVATEDAHIVSLNPYADGEKLNYDLVLGENSEAAGTPVIGNNGMLYHAVNSFNDPNQIDILEINADGTINDDFFVTILNDEVSSSLTMDNNGVIYFGTKGGKLYAVQTGARGLSSQAPWPTFRHDTRNTGNSGL